MQCNKCNTETKVLGCKDVTTGTPRYGFLNQFFFSSFSRSFSCFLLQYWSVCNKVCPSVSSREDFFFPIVSTWNCKTLLDFDQPNDWKSFQSCFLKLHRFVVDGTDDSLPYTNWAQEPSLDLQGPCVESVREVTNLTDSVNQSGFRWKMAESWLWQ